MPTYLIMTQCEENYGNRWKPKGGNDYVVTAPNVDEAVRAVESHKIPDNEFHREYFIGTDEVSADYMTEHERAQMEYDGKITYPAHRLMVGRG